MTEILKFNTKWNDSDRTILLYVMEDKPIGSAIIDINPRDKDEGMFWNLQVDKEFRHMGTATRLLEEATKVASEKGCIMLCLEWNPKDSGGWVLDWYKRKGFAIQDSGRCSIVRMIMKLPSRKGAKK